MFTEIQIYEYIICECEFTVMHTVHLSAKMCILHYFWTKKGKHTFISNYCHSCIYIQTCRLGMCCNVTICLVLQISIFDFGFQLEMSVALNCFDEINKYESYHYAMRNTGKHSKINPQVEMPAL